VAGVAAVPLEHAARPGRLDVAFVMEQDVGHAVQALHLRRELARLDHVDWRYVPVTFHEPRGAIEKLRFLPAGVRASLRARREVQAGLAQANDPDVLFWNTQKPALFCPGLLTRIPSVISLDVTPRQYDEMGEEYGHTPDRPGPLASLKHEWNKRVFKQAYRLLPATNWVARSLVEDYGVAPERMEVLPPGTDLQRFRPAFNSSTSERSPLRVLFVGGDFHRKGGDIVLEWFRSAARPNVEVHIVTRDPVDAAPGVVIHDLTYEDEKFPALYRQSDVFVLPTRAECFGLVLTEAMASGLPCVTCPVGGVPEVVLDSVTGLHTAAGDLGSFGQAMNILLADAGLRRRLGEAGRLRAEALFDANKNVRRIVEILREAAEERRATVESRRRGKGKS
jgi:glycosyltransferase involved in cell wall biosynthesis